MTRHGAMAARDNSSVICSIAFIGIVEYARRSVDEQMRVKAQLNGLLTQALKGVPAGERIILDTAEGAAISFLGDAEDCLYFALSLRDALAGRSDDLLRLRIGINLGPVRLVKDLTGQPNIIGDGIDVGQRILGFAEANQVLASRSFYEAVSALNSEHAQLFDFLGSRTDQQVREHDLYRLNETQAPTRAPHAPQTSGGAAQTVPGASFLAAARAQLLGRPPLATALAVALILMLAVGLRVVLHRADTGHAIEPLPEAPAQVSIPEKAPGEPRKALPAPVAEPPPPTAAQVELPQPPKKPVPPEPSATPGAVRLTVAPWGEVYVNGEKAGVAPPLRDLALKPGRYRIEIRNPGFESHLQIVEIKGGEEIRIRHRFE